jgi:hypothetical protein
MENKQSTKGYIIIFSLVGILFSGIIVNESDVRPHYLNNHLDVDTTGESSGDVLKFNGTKWIPDNDLTGGGGSGGNIFNQDLNTTNNVTFNNLTLTMYPFLDKNYSDDFDGTWGSLTGKPTKAHPHNQDLNTSSSPTFNVINGNGSGLTIDWNDIYYKPNWLTSFAHPHNQNLNTTNAVTFTTINTGEGANELYDMNQNVQTTNKVVFSSVSPTSQNRARAYISSGTIGWKSWSTWKLVNLSVESYDIGDDFDRVNFRYVVPADGCYLISYGCGVVSFSDRWYLISTIRVNGVDYGKETSYVSLGSAGSLINSGSDIVDASSGQYIELWAYVFGSTGQWYFTPNSTYLSIYQLV